MFCYNAILFHPVRWLLLWIGQFQHFFKLYGFCSLSSINISYVEPESYCYLWYHKQLKNRFHFLWIYALIVISFIKMNLKKMREWILFIFHNFLFVLIIFTLISLRMFLSIVNILIKKSESVLYVTIGRSKDRNVKNDLRKSPFPPRNNLDPTAYYILLSTNKTDTWTNGHSISYRPTLMHSLYLPRF